MFTVVNNKFVMVSERDVGPKWVSITSAIIKINLQDTKIVAIYICAIGKVSSPSKEGINIASCSIIF